MKTTFLFFMMLAIGSHGNTQAVGIGTATPGNNAVLDVTSVNKGILLPRLADTSAVSNPSEGLMIYNKNTKSPSFHDGTKWQNLLNSAATANDSVTYTILNTNGGFVPGVFNVTEFSQQITSNGSPTLGKLLISKGFDANSIPFKRSILSFGPGSVVIEFKMFYPGASMPYYSVKIQTVRVVDAAFSGQRTALQETYQLDYTIIGFKDWITNQSFGYQISNGQIVAY